MTSSVIFGHLFCLHIRAHLSDWLQWFVLRKRYYNSYELLHKELLVKKTSFSCYTTHICKGLIEIPSHPWSIKIVKIEVAGFKFYIPTCTFSKVQFQILIEIPFGSLEIHCLKRKMLGNGGCKLRYVNLIYCDHIITRSEVIISIPKYF